MKKLLLAFALLGVLSSGVSAQQTTKTDAHLFGHVIDKKSREHVAYATIVLIGTTLGTTTDATGHFLLKNLPFGDYEVEVRALGYATERKKVCMHASGMVEANFEIT